MITKTNNNVCLGTKRVKRRILYLPFLIICLLSHIGFYQGAFAQTDWTEEKIGKAAVKADKAAMRKKWSQAIKYGERMLAGSEALYGVNNSNTISRLKTLNRYYDKAGRLTQIPARVKKAYLLSKEHFKPSHNTAVINRLLYYKLLIAQKDFQIAIPLVLENMEILTNSKDDQFKLLHYLGQLHGLYGLTDQLVKREKALLQTLELNKKLVGENTEDNMKIIMNLAKTYCLQNKTTEFKALMQTYDLGFEC